MPSNRRRFSRIPFDAQARLQQDNWQAQAQLIDISLRGMLITQPDNWAQVNANTVLQVTVELSALDHIHMEVRQAFARDGVVGLACSHIDLDSMSHLKRLITLNLGDEALAERELAALQH